MGSCLSNNTKESKLNHIFYKFPLVTIDKLNNSKNPQSTTGIVVPAVNKVISPISNQECIFYKVIVEEIETSNVDGSIKWNYLFEEIIQLDFYLIDPSKGNQSLYIPASKAPITEFGVVNPTIESYYFSGLYTQSINDLLARNNYKSFKGLRFTETVIPVYDQISILSIIKSSDASGSLIQYSEPIPDNNLDSKYYNENHWKDWEVNSWHELHINSIIISNNPKTFKKHKIPKISTFPSFLPVLSTPLDIHGYPQFSDISNNKNVIYLPVNEHYDHVTPVTNNNVQFQSIIEQGIGIVGQVLQFDSNISNNNNSNNNNNYYSNQNSSNAE